MLKTIALLCLASQFLTIEAAVTVPVGETSSCRECAGVGTNKMCIPDGAALPSEASVVCCSDTVFAADGTTVVTAGNMDQEYCKASTTNKCSAAFAA